MFDKNLLSLGILMNKSHRNYANVNINDGKVIIVNGDGTLAIKYSDPSLMGLNFSFPISEFPDRINNVRGNRDSVIFETLKGTSKKTITVKASEYLFDKIDSIFNRIKSMDTDYKTISMDSIELLDKGSFFNIIIEGSKVSLQQFHGYSGRLSLVKDSSGSIGLFDSGDSEKKIKIGTITDIFRIIYSNLINIKFLFNENEPIYGIGFIKGNKVEFLISNATWDD